MDAARTAFNSFVDYAGLYPPASLPFEAVVANYGRYRQGGHAWLLGRLIIPVDRLRDAESLAAVAGASPSERWPVSVLVGGPADVSSSSLTLARAAARADSVIEIQSLEATASTPEDIARLGAAYPAGVERFVEIPADPDPSALLAALARAGMAGKIRTGGITADRIPSTAFVARFLVEAVRAHVPLKATAGLHHAIRGERPLTYDDDSPRSELHGFANLVFAATLLAAGKIDGSLAEALLDDDRPEVFKFGGRAGSWLNAVLTYGEFADARERVLRSVGSCSFDEPVQELQGLGWIA